MVRDNKTVAVIGCGNVGTQFAMATARAGYDIYLYDVVEGLAKGRALDLAQAQQPLNFESQIKAIDNLDEVLDCDAWVITAGKPRKPGMSRADLARENLAIIREIAEKARRVADKTIFILVTNPLDIVVTKFLEYTGFERNRVLGMGGVLDSARMAYFISVIKNISPLEVEPWVLGAHSDTMVPVFSLTKIRGQVALEVLTPEERRWVAERTINGGAEIVSYLKTGSAFLAPGAAAFRLLKAALTDEKVMLPVSVLALGEYGFNGAAIGLPVIVGSSGVEKIVEIELLPEEEKALRNSFEEISTFLREV
jgi:malate dehydrogenase